MKKLYILIAICLTSALLLGGCVPIPDGDGVINENGGRVNPPSSEENNTDGENGHEDNDGITEGEENKAPEGNEGIEDNDGITEGEENKAPEGNEGNEDNITENPEENTPEAPDKNDTEGTDDTPVEPEQPKYGTGVGDLFIGVTLETLDGGSISTADLKGKVIILKIWATWCPPCKAELPDFNTVAGEYKDEVVIIAAHTPNGNTAAESYVNTNFPATDIVFAYDTPNSLAYAAAGGDGYVPYTAIIDQSGVIVYSASGILSHSQLTSIIEGLLGE